MAAPPSAMTLGRGFAVPGCRGSRGRGRGRRDGGKEEKGGPGLATVGVKVTWTGSVGDESGRRGELEKRGAQGKEECVSWEKIGGQRKGVWGERLASGPHQEERRRRRNRPRAARGGCGWAAAPAQRRGREGASWAAVPPAHGVKGKGRGGSRPRGGGEKREGRLGRARGGCGWAVPGNRPKRGRGAFLFIFPYFLLTISSNPLLSANFMESSKYSQGKLMCGSA
jgi:hypothetical protein